MITTKFDDKDIQTIDSIDKSKNWIITLNSTIQNSHYLTIIKN